MDDNWISRRLLSRICAFKWYENWYIFQENCDINALVRTVQDSLQEYNLPKRIDGDMLKSICNRFSEKDALEYIKTHLRQDWPLHRVNPHVISLLITALHEWKLQKTDKKILLSQYIQIAKIYQIPEIKFINGILGKL